MVLISVYPGFFISSTVFFTLNKLFPVAGMGEFDEVDTYGTLTPEEATNLGIIPTEPLPVVYAEDSVGSTTKVTEVADTKKVSLSA